MKTYVSKLRTFIGVFHVNGVLASILFIIFFLDLLYTFEDIFSSGLIRKFKLKNFGNTSSSYLDHLYIERIIKYSLNKALLFLFSPTLELLSINIPLLYDNCQKYLST